MFLIFIKEPLKSTSFTSFTNRIRSILVYLCILVLICNGLASLKCKREPLRTVASRYSLNVNVLKSILTRKDICPMDLLESTKLIENEVLDTSFLMPTSLAVVPYQEDLLFPHQRPNRTFRFGRHIFDIEQKWKEIGVAAVVWDAAEVLADYIHKNPETVKGKKVLELGAGTGLTGLLAAAVGGEVTVTERAEAIQNLKTIVDKNTEDKNLNISVATLDWTSESDRNKFTDYQVILGADIVYIEETFSDLLKTFHTVVNRDSIDVFLSCKIRYERDTNFLKLLENDFLINEILYNKEKDVRIFYVKWKA